MDEIENKPTDVQSKISDTNDKAQSAEPTDNAESQQQINWKKFREARDVERKQKIEAERKAVEKEAEATALKAAMESLLSKSSSDSNHPEKADDSEEERISRLVRKSMDIERQKDWEERRKKEQAEFPQRLTSTYSDFNQVCNSDNLDYLEFHYPEVADAFKELPNGYDKWSKIYKAVKRFVPNIDSKKEQAKAEKNFNKPQAMSIGGKTQVGDTAPQQLDEARRAANWERMRRVMKGGGS